MSFEDVQFSGSHLRKGGGIMQVGQRDKLLTLVRDTAKKFEIEPEMLDAIVTKESTYDPYAMQYEPDFIWLSTPSKFAAANKTSVEFETELQKTSLGLCQIMGGTARDAGHKGHLVRLFEPKANLTISCQHIRRLQKRYSKLEDIISAYNAGSVRMKDNQYSNQDYVDSVLDWMRKLR